MKSNTRDKLIAGGAGIATGVVLTGAVAAGVYTGAYAFAHYLMSIFTGVHPLIPVAGGLAGMTAISAGGVAAGRAIHKAAEKRSNGKFRLKTFLTSAALSLAAGLGLSYAAADQDLSNEHTNSSPAVEMVAPATADAAKGLTATTPLTPSFADVSIETQAGNTAPVSQQITERPQLRV